ncbi:type II toxin-antitoxin system VapC family toxin [Eggerthella lenta]|uniref:type II toxin-antitoxin system VapC family toxin n=1 Tax=Eggerthella lenta TaxID=84112 RepID=UPI0032C141C4
MYLLDSCICIDFLRGRLPYAYDLMRNSDPRLFKIPAIVEGELLVGVEKSSRPEKARWLVDEFTLPFDVLPFDSDCAREYGRIRALLERSGKKIGHNDLFIAATALANNAVLVTNNVDEFKRVPGLSLECWYEMKWDG